MGRFFGSTLFPFCASPQGDAYLASTGCIPNTLDSEGQNAERLARFALALQAHCDTCVPPHTAWLALHEN